MSKPTVLVMVLVLNFMVFFLVCCWSFTLGMKKWNLLAKRGEDWHIFLLDWRYCDACRHAVCVCVRHIIFGSEGNALCPVLSSLKLQCVVYYSVIYFLLLMVGIIVLGLGLEAASSLCRILWFWSWTTCCGLCIEILAIFTSLVAGYS